MTNTNASSAMSASNNLDALEAALDDFNLEEVIEAGGETDAGEEIVEETVETTVISEAEMGDLESTIERTEAYASQESTPIADPAAAPATPAKAAKTPRAASAPRAPRASRDLNTIDDPFFVLEGSLSALTVSPTAKAETIALRPAQVKIAEKFDNLFSAIAVGAAPSTYVMAAFKLLDEKKTVTSADLIGAYKASGLGEGTARSQTGQIMALFAAVKIASRGGQALTLNANSTIAERLRAIA